MGLFDMFKKKERPEDAARRARSRERAMERVAALKANGGLHTNTEEITPEERLRRSRAGTSDGSAPAAPRRAAANLGFTFSREAGLTVTDANKAKPRLTDITSALGRPATMVVIGDRYFVAEGKTLSGVENKVEMGAAFAVKAVKPEGAEQILEKVAEQASAPAKEPEADAPEVQ